MKINIDPHPADQASEVDLPDDTLGRMAEFVQKMLTSDLIAMLASQDGSDVIDLLTEGSSYGSPMTLHKTPPAVLGQWPAPLEQRLALENKAMFLVTLKMIAAEIDARIPPRSS